MASTPYQWFFRHFLYAPDLRGVTSGGLVESSWTMETNLAIIYLNITKFIINYWTIMIIDIYWTMNYWYIYICIIIYIYIKYKYLNFYIFFSAVYCWWSSIFFWKVKRSPGSGVRCPSPGSWRPQGIPTGACRADEGRDGRVSTEGLRLLHFSMENHGIFNDSMEFYSDSMGY